MKWWGAHIWQVNIIPREDGGKRRRRRKEGRKCVVISLLCVWSRSHLETVRKTSCWKTTIPWCASLIRSSFPVGSWIMGRMERESGPWYWQAIKSSSSNSQERKKRETHFLSSSSSSFRGPGFFFLLRCCLPITFPFKLGDWPCFFFLCTICAGGPKLFDFFFSFFGVSFMPTLFLFLFSSSSCSIPPLTGEDREKKERKRK